ncbi:MAG: ATP-binding protein [Burkholderiales bacterium]|nr:ATP-binding protein [Burkholderiales bacterium]
MATKLWVSDALQILTESLASVPHEQNELDWKTQLSDHKDWVAEHLMAFANHPNGGYLVFGVNDAGQSVGVDQQQVAGIVSQLGNLGSDAIDPPLALDHAVTQTDDNKIPRLRRWPVAHAMSHRSRKLAWKPTGALP